VIIYIRLFRFGKDQTSGDPETADVHRPKELDDVGATFRRPVVVIGRGGGGGSGLVDAAVAVDQQRDAVVAVDQQRYAVDDAFDQ